MIAVVVGEDDDGDRIERTADLCERLRKLVVVAGEATIDDRDRTVDVVEISPDPLGAESIDATCDLLDWGPHPVHRRVLPGSGCGSESMKVRAQTLNKVSTMASVSAVGLPTMRLKKQ